MLTFQLLFPEFIASSEFWVLIFDKDSANYNHMSFSLFLGQLIVCVLIVSYLLRQVFIGGISNHVSSEMVIIKNQKTPFKYLTLNIP